MTKLLIKLILVGIFVAFIYQFLSSFAFMRGIIATVTNSDFETVLTTIGTVFSGLWDIVFTYTWTSFYISIMLTIYLIYKLIGVLFS